MAYQSDSLGMSNSNHKRFGQAMTAITCMDGLSTKSKVQCTLYASSGALYANKQHNQVPVLHFRVKSKQLCV